MGAWLRSRVSGVVGARADRSGPVRARPPGVTCLLDDLPEFASSIGADRITAARRDLQARVFSLAKGSWIEPNWPRQMSGDAGLLILAGLLLRRVTICGRHGAELLAGDDVLRPWQGEDAAASMPRELGWLVLRRTRVALLDLEFVRRAAPYPELVGMLIERALYRSRALAVNMAIVHQPRVETRVHMLFWHLADRYGTVRSDGIFVPLRLTHEIIADLVSAQRPTVTVALNALQHDGVLERSGDGWCLHGSPPGALAALDVALAKSASPVPGAG